MENVITQLSQIDWWSFLITLAIVIAAYITIKKGLEELCKHTGWEMPWMRNDRVHRELSEAVIAIKDELVALQGSVSNIQIEIDTCNGNRNHDREDSLHVREEMYNDLNNSTAQLRREFVNSVQVISDKIDALQNETRQRELEKRIDKLRGMIIEFASHCPNPNFKPTIEQYNRIFTAIAEYEEILEEHNLTNGQCTISMDVARERYRKDLETGLLEIEII